MCDLLALCMNHSSKFSCNSEMVTIPACMFSHVQLFAIPWAIAHQAPLSMGFHSKNAGVGCHFLLQGLLLINSYLKRMGFPGGSDGKVSACNVEDPGLIPGLGRSPGEGNGNPLQYACLKKSYGRRSLVGYSPWGCKRSDTTEWLHLLQKKGFPRWR